MSEQHCRYHSRLPSSWYCHACELPLCTTCIPGGDDNFRPGQPRCPHCLTSLDYFGDGQTVQPFWQAAPQLFRYAAAPVLLGMALLSALLSNTLFLVDLFFFVVLIRYGLMIIERLAYGDMTPPPITAAMSGDLDLFFKQLLVLVLMFAIPASFGLISPTLALALIALVTLAVPASIMTLAMTESVLCALNPLYWFRVIWTIGWSYLLLWLAWSSVTAVPELVAALDVAPAWRGILIFVADFLSFYTSVLGYAMMGYLMYEHGRALGLGQRGPRGKSLPDDEYVRREILGSSHILAQRGRLDEAMESIERGLRHAPDDLVLHERKFLILRLDPEHRRFEKYSNEYLNLLHTQQRHAVMANTWLDIVALRPKFVPEAAPVRVVIANMMVERGRWGDAKKLLVNMHSSDPDFSGLADAYLLLARVYLEGLGKIDSAVKVFSFLKQRFPDALRSRQGRDMVGLYQRLKAVS